jgi:DUF4097 and DUF4098 domain-containing protein YvlB
MKKLLIAALLVFNLANAQNKTEKEPYLVKSLSGDNINMVEVQTSGGQISVSASNSGDARVEVFINYPDSRREFTKEEIRKRLEEKYNLDISVSGNKLVASAKPKEKITDWKEALSISFRIYVPKNVSTDLSTSGGSIRLSGLSGKQEFRTSGGSLDIDDVKGNIHGRTSGGSISIENSSDNIDLTTSGGSVEAKNCEGKIRLNTSGGTLHLRDLKGDIKASTSGGSISGKNISGELITSTSGGSIRLTDLACSLEASTSGGSIDVEITALGKYVKLDNSGGNIDLQIPKNKGVDLDLSGRSINRDSFSDFKGKMDDDAITGKLNGGGVPVTVTAHSGRITLQLK